MAYNHLIALFSLLLFTLTCQDSFASSLPLSSDATDKVSVKLYYETLCPGSSYFISYILNDMFKTGIDKIVDLHLVPWGNAKIVDNETFTCQHDEMECILNTVQACAIDVWPEVKKHFPFIHCVEMMVVKGELSKWGSCFEKLRLDITPINECMISGYGFKLELKYAAETEALKPPHEFVPWVVVEGKPLKQEYETVLSYICKAYKGISVPDACKSLLGVIDTPSEKAHQVSYKGTLKKAAKFTRSNIQTRLTW